MPYAKAHRKAKKQEQSDTRRAAGLCKSCSKPAREGKTRCQDCADKRR